MKILAESGRVLCVFFMFLVYLRSVSVVSNCVVFYVFSVFAVCFGCFKQRFFNVFSVFAICFGCFKLFVGLPKTKNVSVKRLGSKVVEGRDFFRPHPRSVRGPPD